MSSRPSHTINKPNTPRGAWLAWSSITIFLCIALSVLTNPASSPIPFFQEKTQITDMSSPFIDLVKARRTYYALNDTLPVGKDKVVNVVEELLQAVPSGFNAQTNRAVVLFGDEHAKLWDLVGAVLKARVSEDQWVSTSERIAGFRAGAGTVR